VLRRKATSKTYLKILMLAGVLAVIGGGAGTFASFTAETTNSGNTFATGTLFLQNDGITNAGGTTTTCKSEAGPAAAPYNQQTCATLFTVPALGASTTVWASLKLTNTGSLDATGVSFKGSCTGASGTTVFGGAIDLCTGLKLVIEEWTQAWGAAVAASCAFPASTTAACTPSTGTALSGLGTVTPLTLAPGGGLNNTGVLLSKTSGANSGTRWFKIGITAPASLDNTYQNRTATFGLTWHIDQA
jgi:predicted ribosomally synthesized peptide with SipW-like signal peptide